MSTVYDDVNNEARAAWQAERPQPYDPGDQETTGQPTRLGPDPWLPFTCPRCGDEDRHGMPRQCGCGWVNYGEAS